MAMVLGSSGELLGSTSWVTGGCARAGDLEPRHVGARGGIARLARKACAVGFARVERIADAGIEHAQVVEDGGNRRGGGNRAQRGQRRRVVAAPGQRHRPLVFARPCSHRVCGARARATRAATAPRRSEKPRREAAWGRCARARQTSHAAAAGEQQQRRKRRAPRAARAPSSGPAAHARRCLHRVQYIRVC